MSAGADVCLIAEGGYPYVVGGVSSWADALMRASPQLSFHVIAISVSSQARRRSFVLPANAVDVTDVILDVCPRGRTPAHGEADKIKQILGLLEIALTSGDRSTLEELIEQMRITGFGQAALLDSKEGWHAMERAYERLLPNGPLLDFFWSWRFLVRSLLAMMSTPLPQARVFHAVATGFSGVVGSYARLVVKTPLLVTEHGIYTNERRIELAVADWLFDSEVGGFDVATAPAELRSIWLNAFQSFSRISYAVADVITTQYRANQSFQRADGAPDDKLRIIPNGIDFTKFAAVPRDAAAAANGGDDRAHSANKGHSNLHNCCRPAQGSRAECVSNPHRTGGRGSRICCELPPTCPTGRSRVGYRFPWSRAGRAEIPVLGRCAGALQYQ